MKLLSLIKPLISRRDNAEEALRESEEKYRSLFEHMFIAFAYHKVITDESGRPVDYEFLEINDAFEKLTGLKKTKEANSLLRFPFVQLNQQKMPN